MGVLSWRVWRWVVRRVSHFSLRPWNVSTMHPAFIPSCTCPMTPIVLFLYWHHRLFRRMPVDSQSIVKYRIYWRICSSKIGPSRRTIRCITVDANRPSARTPTTNKSTRCTRSPASWVCMVVWRSSSNGCVHESSICWWRHLDAARSVLHRCNRVCRVMSPWLILKKTQIFSFAYKMLDLMSYHAWSENHFDIVFEISSVNSNIQSGLHI